jgi:GAF domain-containing protein
MSEIGEAIWAHLRSRIPADAFVLYTYEQADDSIAPVFEASADPRCHARPSRMALGERLSGWVAATGQVAVNSDARLDLDDDVRSASPLRGALAAPVTCGDRTIGVISFYACAAAPFDDGHRQLCSAAGAALGAHVEEITAGRFWPAAAGSENRTPVSRN